MNKKLKILNQVDSKTTGDTSKVLTERGIQNPKVIDLIHPVNKDIVEIFMVEERPWGNDIQITQLEEKFNVYLGYVLEGFFTEQYPDYKDRSVHFILECKQAPHGEIKEMINAMQQYATSENIEFEVRITG